MYFLIGFVLGVLLVIGRDHLHGHMFGRHARYRMQGRVASWLYAGRLKPMPKRRVRGH